MMTAGKPCVNPLAGLPFPDRESGATLQLSGTAEMHQVAPPRPTNGQEMFSRITEAI